MLDTKTEQKCPLTIVDGIAKGHFFLGRNEKGALPTETPQTTVIIPQPPFPVNYLPAKSFVFSIFHHLSGSFLFEIPYCTEDKNVVD